MLTQILPIGIPLVIILIWIFRNDISLTGSVYLKVKESNDSRGLSLDKTYKVIKSERSLLCYERHLIKNDFDTHIFVCDFDIDKL